MKRMLLLGLCLWSVMLVNGQQITYEYQYDAAGNRTRSTVVQLNNRDGCGSSHEQTPSPLTDMLSNGLAMKIFPNPTKESVRFEVSGENKIGEFVLTDIAGRTLAKGYCEDSSLNLDLSDYKEGVFLLEVVIGGKQCVYKIIKQ